MVTDRDAENAARLRRAYAAFSRGDFDAAFGEGLRPDFEYVPAGGLTPVRGAEGFRRWMEPDAFESQTVEPVEIRRWTPTPGASGRSTTTAWRQGSRSSRTPTPRRRGGCSNRARARAR